MNENRQFTQNRLSPADFVLVALFTVILAIILAAVFFRYVVNQSLFWSDEVVRYLFVWFTLLGAALVLRDRRHIRVEFFVDQMPDGLRRATESTGLVLILAFNVFLVVAGLLWVQQTSGTYTPALGLPQAALQQVGNYLDAIVETDVSEVDGRSRNPARVRALMKSVARNVAVRHRWRRSVQTSRGTMKVFRQTRFEPI